MRRSLPSLFLRSVADVELKAAARFGLPLLLRARVLLFAAFAMKSSRASELTARGVDMRHQSVSHEMGANHADWMTPICPPDGVTRLCLAATDGVENQRAFARDVPSRFPDDPFMQLYRYAEVTTHVRILGRSVSLRSLECVGYYVLA